MRKDPYTDNDLLEMGDWVCFSSKGTDYTGFVMGLELSYAKVFVVKASSSTTVLKNTLIKLHYYDATYIPPIELTEEEIKQSIDIALDIKDENLFMEFTRDLLLLQEKNKVLS